MPILFIQGDDDPWTQPDHYWWLINNVPKAEGRFYRDGEYSGHMSTLGIVTRVLSYIRWALTDSTLGPWDKFYEFEWSQLSAYEAA